MQRKERVASDAAKLIDDIIRPPDGPVVSRKACRAEQPESWTIFFAIGTIGGDASLHGDGAPCVARVSSKSVYVAFTGEFNSMYSIKRSRILSSIILITIFAAGNLCLGSPGSAQQPSSSSAPTLVGPICPDQKSVMVSNSTAGATLTLQINDSEHGRAIGAPGEISLVVALPAHLAQGDVVRVAQQTAAGTTLTNAVSVGCVDVLTYHNDQQRTGWNDKENTLTTANVALNSFGMVAQVGPDVLDDQIDTQPLIVTQQSIEGLGTHNVVYLATASNTVYALDAWSGQKLLSTNLGKPVPMPLDCDNNAGTVGVTGTPTIDRASQTLYLISYTLEAGQPTYKLHALELSSLKEKPGSPTTIGATQKLNDQTDFAFNATYQRQRAALLQANGNIYAGFASFCDQGGTHSRGWVLGWNARTLAPLSSSVLTDRRPDATTKCLPGHTDSCFLSSVWMSGYGLAVDQAGNIFFVTGNSGAGSYDGTVNISESMVKMSSTLAIMDLFTPNNVKFLDTNDTDFGSGGVLVLPDLPSEPLPHLAAAAGKDGRMFIVNRDNLGGFRTPDEPAHVLTDLCLCGPSFFQGADGKARVVSSGGHTVRSWIVDTTRNPQFTLEASAPIARSAQAGGFFTSISSGVNVSRSAIIWAVGRPVGADKHLTLYAFEAAPSNGALTLLWSAAAGNWQSKNNSSDVVPTAANGMVYVASYRQLNIFGLKRPQPASEVASLQVRRFQAGMAEAPPEPHFGPTFWGTVLKVDGSHLLLELRTGRVLDVDIGPAVKSGRARIVTPGDSAKVSGTTNPQGIFEANFLWRESGQELWGEDRAQ
jgi:hypothetical protein